jgi:hypothetical protein
MKFSTRIKTLAMSTFAAAALFLGASMAPASAQVVAVQAQIYPGEGCPVPQYQLRDVLSGMYGVDAFRRPVNQFGFPVDYYGNCLTPAPVGEVFNYQPSQIYVNWLWVHFSYRYYYNPRFVHIYVGPGVIIHRGYGAVPLHPHVIIQNNYRAPLRTVTPVGPTTTIRPGASNTVRPGAGPANVAPPRSVHPGQPTGTSTPSSVTPPRAATPTTTFNRPPAAKAPSSVTPPKAATPSHTFNRPPHK